METALYLEKFQQAVNSMDKQLFVQNNLELKVGVWIDSVVLKIQKKAWLGNSPSAKPFSSSVFFSVWTSDKSIGKSQLLYNIHALKLREVKGYTLRSRDFAADFRSRFKPFENQWPNVSTQFGPLTLMEGYMNIDTDNFEREITELALKFTSIQFIIDDLFAARKK